MSPRLKPRRLEACQLAGSRLKQDRLRGFPEAQRPLATASQVPAHAVNGRTIPCQTPFIETMSRKEWEALARRLPVLAQRAASEGPRWTRTPREPARPPPGMVRPLIAA